MKVRIISGAVVGVLFLSAILIGGYYLYALMLAAALIGQNEFYRVYGIGKAPEAIVGYIATGLIFLTFALDVDNTFKYIALILTAAFIAIMTFYVFRFNRMSDGKAMAAFFGIVYVGLMLAFVCNIREIEYGKYFVWFIFIGSWLNDTFAYFIGSMFGKRKFVPVLSPKKTVEGAIGGIAASGIVGLIYGAVLIRIGVLPPNVLLLSCVLGLVGAGFGVIGDLFASAIKRNRNVKDYGKIIPGHGGILDRFDSVIFTGPVVYWLLMMFI